MSAWAYVEDGIPDNGVSVLVTFTDRGGRRRATVATLYGEQELESVDQDDRCGGVYDEDTDKYWAPPGWYETPWSAEEVYPLDGVVVAWRPLTVAPEKDGEQ